MPAILLVQTTYSLTTVFICLATLLVIAAASVNLLGPEAKQKGLDDIAPPTNTYVDAGNSFWLKFAGSVALLLSVSWWLYFYLAAKEVANTVPCFLYTTDRCQTLITTAEAAGKFAFKPYLSWVGIVLVVAGFVAAAMHKSKAVTKTA